MRLIDADELIKTYEKETGYTWSATGILECPKCFIDNAPTVEIPVARWDCYCEGQKVGYEKALSERPQGKWIIIDYDKKLYKHDCCNEIFEYPYNYCPNCGAGMEMTKNDD